MSIRGEEEGRTQIVQSIQHNVKLSEPLNVVLGFFDISMDGRDANIGIEWCSCLSSDLF
jgi:hypothetical protein